MKKFRIFISRKSQSVEADRVECKKTPTGLRLKFFVGKKVSARFEGATILMEDTPEIKIEIPKNENQDDD